MADETIKLNFQVLESRNPQLLLIGDFSVWEYAEDLPAYVFITIAGSSKPLQFSWKKYSVNQFNSNNLGLSCITNCDEQKYIDLPDGIYTICLQSNFQDIKLKKYYLKTDRFDVEMAKIIVEKGLEYKKCNNNFIDDIYKIKFNKDLAKSFAIEGNFVESQRYFNEAVKNLNKHKECITCD